jgi:nucleotide-binding universal stress UspA family protein
LQRGRPVPSWSYQRLGSQTVRRIIVGVDGSRHSIEALRFAYRYASRSGASIIALHAWTAVDYYVNISEGDDIVSAWRNNADLALAESLAGWAAEFPDVTVSRAIGKRHPVESMVEHSHDADLLVVGTSGRRGPAPLQSALSPGMSWPMRSAPWQSSDTTGTK